MTSGEVVEDASALERWRPAWDELAVATRRPYCSPAWMLAWWRCARPPGASLRTVVVTEGEDLVGIAPMFVERAPGGVLRARMLASPASHRTEPLAVPGREQEVAARVAAALAFTARPPALMMLEAIPFSSPWPQAFASVWPGRSRPWLVHDRSVFAPFVRLEGRTFDEWLASKSYHFRKHSRSARRSLEKRGAIVRVVTEPDELTAAVEELVRLHRARWDWRGGTAVLDDRSEPMLVEAGRGLLAEARFRLVRVDVDGLAIGSFLCLAAGGEVAACLSGHDDAWAAHSPSGVALIASIEQACSLGDVRFDLGGGRQSYKYRFADGEESLAWWTLVLPGPRYLETRLRLALRRGYRRTSSGLARRLPRDIKRRLKNLMRGRSEHGTGPHAPVGGVDGATRRGSEI